MVLLALSLFFTNPVPLDMPRAQAFLVREDGAQRLEDRYCRSELWFARASLGRWEDDDGRVFALYRLDVAPPAVGGDDSVTRAEYTAGIVRVKRRDERKRRWVIETLSPCEITEKGRPPRQMPRGFKDVDYWQDATNLSTIVCAFRPEKDVCWYLATWELVEGDNIYERMNAFEDGFLAKEVLKSGFLVPTPDLESLGERELLRHDAHHSVTNYDVWRCTDAPEFTVLDDLPRSSRSVVTAFTNELPVLRRRYAETIPSPIDGSNVLCVARIFGTRDEYLDAAGEEMAWSAAYWSPARRELVAHLPAGGEGELLKTVRHEAFHQYLSYAASMIPASPWLNEGYAQYFEDPASGEWGADLEMTPERIDRLAESLPGLFGLDYEGFYAGTDAERRLKYRLAWSVAYFIEKGAPKVRFDPFANLKRDYVNALLETQDMRRATSAAFGNEDRLRLFIAEWKKFWKNT